jgi:hypothetical protein
MLAPVPPFSLYPIISTGYSFMEKETELQARSPDPVIAGVATV